MQPGPFPDKPMWSQAVLRVCNGALARIRSILALFLSFVISQANKISNLSLRIDTERPKFSSDHLEHFC